MPFDTLPPLSAGLCDTTSHSVIPTATAQRPTLPSGGPAADALQLALMPNEILVRIAGYLRPIDALALSQGARGIFAALRRDVVDPLRLHERIRWIYSLSGMQAAHRDVLAAPEDRRRPLLQALAGRIGSLHRVLQEPTRQLLAPYREGPPRLWWDELYAPAEPARERFFRTRRQGDCHDDLLSRVLASPPQARGRLFQAWFDDTYTLPPSVGEWHRILSAVPPTSRGKLLTVMAKEMPTGPEYDQCQAFVVAAVRQAAPPDASMPADYASVLKALAHRLVENAPDWELVRFAESWCELYSFARRLPLPLQPKVLAKLAWSVRRYEAEPANDPAQPHPRWQEFIGYVRAHFQPADVAMILGRLARYNNEADEEELERPILEAIVQAARALPDEWHATLLARAAQHGPTPQESAALWDEAFLAAARAPQANAAAMYGRLADAVNCLGSGIGDARWHALAQRIETAVPATAMLPVLVKLGGVSFAPMTPQRRAAFLRIGARLSAQDRSVLSAMIAATPGITPQTWRMHVNELEALPREFRRAPARELAMALFHYQQGIFELASGEAAPDPRELLCARMPRTPEEALTTLSEILSQLSLADRGAVLLGLVPTRWSVARVRWLLDEVSKLGPLEHHAIGVVAHVCGVVAERCPDEADARSLLPLLESAVGKLPVDARASPLLMIGSLIERLLKDKPTFDRWKAQVSALPAEDAALAIGSRKRKAAPG